MKSLPKILLLALALGTGPQVLAGKPEPGDLVQPIKGNALIHAGEERKLRPVQSNGPTLSEAVEMVKRQCKCRIVDARTDISGGREIHVIRFMTEDGTVKTARIPGRSSKP